MASWTWCSKDETGSDLVDLDKNPASDENGEAICGRHAEEQAAKRAK